MDYAVKLNLNHYGLDVFLAHEDIEPTEEWQTRILSELKRASVFLPLLTDKFITSKWTAQECGIAVARGTFIGALLNSYAKKAAASVRP